MRLGDEIERHQPLELYKAADGVWSTRPVSRYPSGVIARYGPILAIWWRTSPSAVLECSDCGEIRLTGKRIKAKKCGSCRAGEFRPMDLDDKFTRKRPRGRKKKL